MVLLTDSKASSGNKKSSHPQSYEKNKLKAPEPKKNMENKVSQLKVNYRLIFHLISLIAGSMHQL